MAHVIHCPVMEFWSIGILILFIRPLPRFAASSYIVINRSCSFVLREFCLSICRKISSLVCLLFCLTHIFHFCFSGNWVYFFCYVFSVVSFFCFAIIAPFSCHMLLISTPLALLSFVSIVPCAVSSSLLFFIYYFSVSLSLLLGFCAWFPRIFSSGLLVPTSFLTYCLAFLVFFPFFRCSALFAVEALS